MRTLTFNQVFKDYETFKVFTNQFKLYDEADTTAEAFNKHIYNVLRLHYNDCAIAYETTDEFKAEFAIAYCQYFYLFLQKEKLLKEIYKLTTDDYILIGQNLSNISNNPNYITKDPWELLDFTSIQNRSRSTSNKLQAYIVALRTLPDAQINALIEGFDYLWLDLLDSENEYYY